MAVADDATLTELSYSPYGVTTTEAHANDFRYTGRAQIADDLYEYRSRYYDTDTARFLVKDFFGISGGLNSYAYVEGNRFS